MKKYLFIILFFSSICLSVVRAEVRYIYVSPSGNDLNPGTKAQPVASLTGARDKIRLLKSQTLLNDTVYVEVMSGNYYIDTPLLLSPLDAGANRAPIVYRGQSSVHPSVFYGGKEVGRFEIVNPALWRVYVPEVAKYGLYFEQLYINGERRFRAQTPNRGEFNLVNRVQETVLDSSGERLSAFAVQKVTLREDGVRIISDLDANEWNDVLMVFYHNWDNTRKRVEHASVKDTALYAVGGGMKPWNKINADSRYVVENYRKALDAPGEWFLQRDGYLYYIPMPGETPENTHGMFPANERFITVEGNENKPVEHIRFENLSFQVAAYRTPANGNDPMQAAAETDATVMLDYAGHIDFLNCEIAHTGLYGIWFRKSCSHSTVEHCRLFDLGAGAVKIGVTSKPASRIDLPDTTRLTHHIKVHNNIMQHGGYIFPCAVGVIIFHGSDNEITHNEIADFRYSGISAGWIWGYDYSPSKRNKIEFNHIHHLGWGELSDMGGVYTLGASEGTTVSNNVIHHIYSYSYGGWGLYTDEGSYKVVMENNLVYACKNAGFHQHYGKENLIRNNIFALNQRSELQLTRVEEHVSLIFTRNIIYFSEGLLYMSMGENRWPKADVTVDRNCYWDTRTRTPKFHDELLFADWQQLGRDQHSIIADPLFVNPEQFDFRFKKLSVAKKIGFQPFDYSKAGVYGSSEWIEKSRLDEVLIKKFDAIVTERERSHR